MYCQKCGAEIKEGTKFCQNCGAKVNTPADDIVKNVKKEFNSAEKQLEGAVVEVKNTFENAGNPGGGKEKLQSDRGLLAYILLNFITCGIYGYYFIYKLAHDVNIACEGDGEETGGLVQFILLSFVTCGIYAWVWYYKLGNRLAANAPRYGLSFQENGTTVILWCVFGVLICGVGPYIAAHILIKNTNAICQAYNEQNGLF